MATRWFVPSLVPLPGVPALATVHDPCTDLGSDVVPDLTPGEIVNILAGAPGEDGDDLVYVVACGNGVLREGWLRRSAVRVLSAQETAEAPEAARVRLQEMLRRTCLARVYEEWRDPEQPNSLALRHGRLLQVVSLRDGWGFGWHLSTPSSRGWFPMGCVRSVERTAAPLAEELEPLELPLGAAESLRRLLQGAPPPPPRRWQWEGEMPQVVAESAQRAQREWQDSREQVEAAARMAQEEELGGAQADSATQDPGEGVPEEVSVLPEELPDYRYPLAICKAAFTPPPGTPPGALLEMKVGDLVRVLDGLEGEMYFGSIEARSDRRGWFPRRNVLVVEDPNDESTSVPVHIGPPQLPQVPEFLRTTGVGVA